MALICGRTGVAVAVFLAGLSLAAPLMAEKTAALLEQPGGGWDVTGATYRATFSKDGYLQSLKVGGFEFLAPSEDLARGLYFAAAMKPDPFSFAEKTGPAGLRVGNERARVTMEFLADRIEFELWNLGISDGNPLRMDVSSAVARIRNPDSGKEHELPAGHIAGKARLLGPGGEAMVLPGDHLLPGEGGGYHVKFPHAAKGRLPALFSITFESLRNPGDLVTVTAVAPRADFVYWGGEPQPFTTEITNVMGDQPLKGSVRLDLRYYLTKEVVAEQRREVDLAPAGAAEIEWTLSELDPGLYLADLVVELSGRRGRCCTVRLVWNAGELKPPAEPDDFDAFWQKTLKEQAAVPPDLQVQKIRNQGRHEVYKFNFAGLLGHRCFGWLTLPMDRSRKYPGALLLPSSGMRGQRAPVLADCVAMAININTVDVDLPEEQYAWQSWPAPYLSEGMLTPETYSLRFSYAALVRAAEILAARPEVEPGNILVTGGSQGGGLTLVAAGLYPGFKAAVANLPGLCRLDWNLDYLQPPYFPIAVNDDTRPHVRRTLSYFDAAHFGRRVRAPVWISLGLHDDVTPSVGVFCAFNAVPHDRKYLKVDPLGGHGGGWNPTEAVQSVWP